MGKIGRPISLVSALVEEELQRSVIATVSTPRADPTTTH